MKINSELIGLNEKHFVKGVFFIRGSKVRDIIPLPVWIIPFPVLKINLNPLDHMKIMLKKKFFDPRPGS